jgi:hypothetical protein
MIAPKKNKKEKGETQSLENKMLNDENQEKKILKVKKKNSI